MNKPQRGSTLITALIMLVLLTLIAVSAINSTSSGIQIVGNAQHRAEAASEAQQIIEQAISSTNFTSAAALATYPVTTPISMLNNGVTDYNVTVAKPTCTSSSAITNDMVINNPQAYNYSCITSGTSGTSGIMGAAGVVGTTPAACYLQSWEIQATVTDNNGFGNTVVRDGVSILQPMGTLCP